MTSQDFYDERINAECGRIYQRGILYATLVALLYGLLHGWSLFSVRYFGFDTPGFLERSVFFIPEATVFISGAVILLCGALRHGRSVDEREVFEKHRYYLSAGKAFIIIAFIGYALTIPFSARRLSHDVPLNYLSKLFMILGAIYLYYTFKKRDIFFNYTFIQERKDLYYKRVFLNIAKLAGVLFLGFFAAALLDLGMHKSFLNFFSILVAYVLSVLSLGLEYLFISWTEKISYDEGEHRGLNRGTLVKFLFLLGFVFVNFSVTLLQLGISNGSMGQLLKEQGLSLGEVLASVSNIKNFIDQEISVLTAMILCKFMCQIRECRTARKIIAALLILTSFSVFYHYAITFAISALQQASAYTLRLLIDINQWVTVLEVILSTVLWSVLILDLTRTVRLSPLLWVVSGIQWFNASLLTVSTIWGHLGLAMFQTVAGGLLELGALVLLLILLHRHQYPHEHEEYV